MLSKLSVAIFVWSAAMTLVVADKIFLIYPVTGGEPWKANEPGLIKWQPVIDAATTAFPPKVNIDLMEGEVTSPVLAAALASDVGPLAENYTVEKVPDTLKADPSGGGYFIRMGTNATGYSYGSRFQVTGLPGQQTTSTSTTTTTSTEVSGTSTRSDNPSATAQSDANSVDVQILAYLSCTVAIAFAMTLL